MEIFQSISKNKFSSGLIVTFITLMFGGIIYLLLTYFEFQAYITIPLALGITLITSLVSYNNCDKMVLGISGAKPVDETTDARLHNILEGLTIAAGLPMPKFYIIPDTAPNAFATGKNPEHAVICVTQGLLEKLDDNELEGVLAHELAHIKNYDILLGTIVTVFVGFIVMVSDMFTRVTFRSSRRSSSDDKSGGIKILIALVLIIISSVVAQLMKLALSRKREYMADARAVEFTRNPEGLISALQKISGDDEPLEVANNSTAHLYIVNPFKGKKTLNLLSTHPPIEDRIERLRKLY